MNPMHMFGTVIKIDFQVADVVPLLITSPVVEMWASLKNEVRQGLELLCFVLEPSRAVCPRRWRTRGKLSWANCGKRVSVKPAADRGKQGTQGCNLKMLKDPACQQHQKSSYNSGVWGWPHTCRPSVFLPQLFPKQGFQLMCEQVPVAVSLQRGWVLEFSRCLQMWLKRFARSASPRNCLSLLAVLELVTFSQGHPHGISVLGLSRFWNTVDSTGIFTFGAQL